MFIADIDHTLHLLDNVISFYEVSSGVEDIIEKGPNTLTETGVELDEYLRSLNRLAKAQKYFEKHIPQSVELENVVCKLCIFYTLILRENLLLGHFIQ